ncbi:MAG: ACT domain-containing protein, partial [Betaproteobacteria bacterium]
MRFILTLSCPDRPGIVHAVSGFLLAQNGNILEAAQFDDAVTGVFFMRVCFEQPQSDAKTPAQMDELFAPLAG